MSAGAVGAAIAAQRERLLINYFKDKGAISPDTAILISANEIHSHLKGVTSTYELDRRSYIQKTPDERYFFDEQQYNLEKSRNKKIAVMLLLSGLLLLLVLMFF